MNTPNPKLSDATVHDLFMAAALCGIMGDHIDIDKVLGKTCEESAVIHARRIADLAMGQRLDQS